VCTIARPNNNQRQGKPQPKGNPINEEIRASELRVIDEEGEQAGIMLLEVAQQLALSRNLDLVLISPNADPPVARIMDYGKYRYEQQKREKEAKKKQKIIQVKEVRLTPSIESHDLDTKAKMTNKFLMEGDKVKVTMRFRGRERGRTDRGFELMDVFAERIKDYGLPEKRAAFEGRNLVMIIAPLPEKEMKQKTKPPAEKPAPAEATPPVTEEAPPAIAAAPPAETAPAAEPAAAEAEAKEKVNESIEV
jgi:translation initiation factor IF-3